MEINLIKKVVALLEESNLKKLHIKEGDFEISLEKDSHEVNVPAYPIEREKKVKAPDEEVKKEIPVDEKNYVVSPMVGTFYNASAPDQMPFVKVGDKVNENTVVCIIEAMKVMNEIKAGKKGKIKEVLVENASPVEFGTKLFLIEP
ncbi:MAG: acetyl-CoA carboxylase biotin carboxyl carrier protein [Parachlamydiales bacterium]|jgi:acetyl-CoA carboxylase biotin carboxyl carrier protein